MLIEEICVYPHYIKWGVIQKDREKGGEGVPEQTLKVQGGYGKDTNSESWKGQESGCFHKNVKGDYLHSQIQSAVNVVSDEQG